LQFKELLKENYENRFLSLAFWQDRPGRVPGVGGESCGVYISGAQFNGKKSFSLGEVIILVVA